MDEINKFIEVFEKISLTGYPQLYIEGDPIQGNRDRRWLKVHGLDDRNYYLGFAPRYNICFRHQKK